MSSGFPAVRIQAIKRFAEGGGYLMLLDLLRHEQFVWPGGDALLVILKTLNMIEVSANSNLFHLSGTVLSQHFMCR